MQGPSSFVIIEAQTIVINGVTPNSGLFEYSGTGAFGNPPQFAVVSPGVTTDPFGNPIGNSKILIQGNVITMTSGIFRTNASAPLIQLDGPHDCIFVYDASANLIFSLNPGAQTTDGLGHTVYPGFVNFDVTNSAYSQVFNGSFNVGTATQMAGTGGANPGGVSQLVSGTGEVLVSSGVDSSTDVPAQIDLINQHDNPSGAYPTAIFSSSVEFTSVAVPAATINPGCIFWCDTSGYPRYLVSNSGDTNEYEVAHLFGQVNPRSQSFSAIIPANVGGLAFPVGTGIYMVEGHFIIEWNAVAGTPEMVFTGPAINQYDVSFETRQSGSSSTANTNALVAAGTVNGTGYNGAVVKVTGAMTAAGVFFNLNVWGQFNFSAAGTLRMQAQSDTAGDAWIITSGYWKLMPHQ